MASPTAAAHPSITHGVLPADGVLLHVGLYKTGTTALQDALGEARPRLAAAGVRYPGAQRNHGQAARAVLGVGLGPARAPSRIRWRALTREVRSYPGRAVVSSEVFSDANRAQAREIVGGLGGHRVRTVITMRPWEQLLPSVWQEHVKGGMSVRYEDWLATALSSHARRERGRVFWRRYDLPAQVRMWRDAGGGPVTVLIVGEGGSDTLLREFERIAGVSPGILIPKRGPRTNRSLSACEVELIRELNARMLDPLADAAFHQLVRRGGIVRMIEGRTPRPGEPRLSTPAWAARRMRKYGRRMIAELRDMDVEVLGDLSRLVSTEALSDSGEAVPDWMPNDAVAELVEGVVAAAAPRLGERRLRHFANSAMTVLGRRT